MNTLSPEVSIAAETLVRDYMAVRPTENVLITADTATDTGVARAIVEAAERARARTSLMVISQLPFQGRLADPYIGPTLSGAVSGSDVWIDLTFPYLAGSQLYDDAIATKRVRYLLGGDMSSDGLVRLFGRVDLDAYYDLHREFDKLINESLGKVVRITNDAGTDVTFRIGKRGFEKPRRGDVAGSYLLPGACTMFPEVETVKGVIKVGAVFHEYYTALPQQMTLEVNGRIRSLRGGGNERAVMDRALRRAAGGDYGYVIHFTHGIHPSARVTARSFVEDMRTTGNDAVGLGIPWWLPGGGENHPDAILFMQTIELDGCRIVDEGAFVAPSSLVKLASALKPIYPPR